MGGSLGILFQRPPNRIRNSVGFNSVEPNRFRVLLNGRSSPAVSLFWQQQRQLRRPADSNFYTHRTLRASHPSHPGLRPPACLHLTHGTPARLWLRIWGVWHGMPAPPNQSQISNLLFYCYMGGRNGDGFQLLAASSPWGDPLGFFFSGRPTEFGIRLGSTQLNPTVSGFY